MSLGNTTETDILKLYFQALPIANIADNAAIDPLTNLYVSLHTADPGEAGNQTTSQCDYTSYARVNVSRSDSGWTVAEVDVGGSTVKNAVIVSFPQCTGGSNNATHVAIGTAASGAGKIIAKGALDNPLAISNGITPSFAVNALVLSLT